MNDAKNMKKNCLALLVVLLSALLLSATVSGAERMRIIIDTDARAEVDDQNAIAYVLFSGDHFEVEGITVNRGSDGPHRTDRRQAIDDHFKEAVDVVRLCDSWGKFPVIKGPAGNYRQIRSNINNATFDGSDAVNFIIERAHAPSDRPLIIFSIGNLTIPALALLKDPTIAPKIEIWWLGTQWPINRGENNQGGDIDATDALLADPNNVTFNIIPYQTFRPPGAAGVTFAEMIEHFTGRGPQVSPAVNTRLGSFTCFGDFSVELFNRGVGSRQKANGRTLLDMVAATALKNNVGQYTPYEMGAPSFVYEKESATGSESPGWPGRWVENSSNPRRVTIWRYPNRDAVYNDFFHTMDNYVLAGPASQAQEASQIHHREHNLLLDATLSGNMDSFNVGLRRFDGGDCQPKFLVYDFKKQEFLGFSRWIYHPTKKLARKTDQYAYGVKKDADLGVIQESNAAYWLAEWPDPVSANFLTLMGSYPDEPSQANTAWKIELRSNGIWRVHEQGVGGWYDRGQYFWGGRGESPIQFDALRVKLYSKDRSSSLSNIHLRAQENRTWMVANLPPIDARITVTQQVPRAGQVVDFAGNQAFGTVQSWQWNFGDGKFAKGQAVSHTFATAGTYDVALTLSGAGQSAQIVERVTIHPAVEAQITPLPGSVLEGNPVTFDGSNSYGAIGSYQWDFGDGSTATGKQVTKSFAKAGIYQVTLKVGNSMGSNSSSALVRVHTPATVKLPQVLLDADVEEDDIYTIAYALYSELDVLAMTAVHHGGEESGAVNANYDRTRKVIELARQSGLPTGRQPRVFRGADQPLIPPYSDNWRDTEPIVTEASEAILAAARGASPDNPVWVVPLGPLSNVAAAILQARREGWESDFRQRIRVSWLGAGNSSTRVATWNGRRDAWAAHVVAQSGIEFLIMPEPVGITLKWDRREMKDRYPRNPLGDYLYQISPDRNAGWYDPTALAAVISIHANKNWFSNVEGVTVGDRYQDYRFASTAAPTSVRVIRNIDVDAIKNDIFETLNGRPTKLRDSASGTSRSRRGIDGQ